MTVELDALAFLPTEHGGLDGPAVIGQGGKGLGVVLETEEETKLIMGNELEPLCGGLFWKKVRSHGYHPHLWDTLVIITLVILNS